MNRIVFSWALLLALTFAFAPAAQAQEQPLTTVELHELASLKGNAVDADRARVSEFLAQHDVREAVQRAGFDIAAVQEASTHLAGDALADVASQIRQLEDVHQVGDEEDLVGGANTIVISTTTVIIALLILILITD